MIDIDFLTPPMRLKSLSGAEFIEYQGKAFHLSLSEFITNIYDPATYELNWSVENRKKLAELIATYTNILILPQIVDMNNFAINSGFISPNSVLNNPMADRVLSKEDSNIGQFFKEFKKKALVGWCDLKTGKVEGDFKNVPFYLLLPERMFISKEQLEKSVADVTVPQVVAAGIIHEVGHAFFGLYSLSSSVLEDIFFTKTAALIEQEKDPGKKLKIVAEFKKETGIDVSDELNKTGKITVVGFKNGLRDRDYRRTLSLGATQITTEILANAYAVRMGASIAITAIFSVSAKVTHDVNKLRIAELCLFSVLLASGIGGIGTFVLMGFRAMLHAAGMRYELVNSSHETDYRTIKSILRDIIDILRKARDNNDRKAVAELTKEAMAIDKMAEEAKPYLEGSYIQRVMGRFAMGKDAKRVEVETYTAELNYNPLSIYTQFNEKR